MLEKLLDLLEKLWTLFTPVVIIHPWQGAGVMRLGKYHRTLAGGYHPKWPLIEDVVEVETCDTTMRLPPQSLMTKDGVEIVVSSVVKYRIKDVRPYICNVWDQKDVLGDVTMGAIADVIKGENFADLRAGDPRKKVLERVRESVNEYGFKVSRITFPDFCKMRSFRFVQPNAKDLDN